MQSEIMCTERKRLLGVIRELRVGLQELIETNCIGSREECFEATLRIHQEVNELLFGLNNGQRNNIIKDLENELRSWSRVNGFDYAEAMEKAINIKLAWMDMSNK